MSTLLETERIIALAILLPFVAFFLLRLAQYFLAQLRGHRVPVDQEMLRRGDSMLLGQSLRQVFSWCISPYLQLLKKSKISPDVLTFVNFLFALIGATLIGLGAVALGGTVALLGSSLDYLDGRLARESGQATRAGNFLDSTLDRYCDIVLMSGAAVFFRHSIGVLLACLAAMGSASVISYARAKAESLDYQLKVGLMQRPERIVLFCAGAILSPFFDALLPSHLRGFHLLFAGTIVLLAVLTTITALHRTVSGFAALRR